MNSFEDNKPHYSDFSPTIYKDGIVFVSSRHNKGPKFKWDDSPFLDLFYTESDVASAKPFSEALNSKYHEGPIAFYDEYTKAVFTRSNYLDKELGLTEEGVNNLQMYTADWDQSKSDWTNIQPVDFNLKDYSFGHPAITVDNSKMYFISDMPGGFGGTDLYLSERNEFGWGEPVNLGEVINTPGNEMYPFVDNEDNLYFASNGHGGLGGLDVYQVKLTDRLVIRNMGYPLNTTADDFGLTLTPDGDIAYISSNREGADNIFQIDITAPDLEIILADNAIDGEPPSIDETIETLATTELSTFPEDQFSPEELSTINASVIGEDQQFLNDADLKLLVNGEESKTLVSNDEGKITFKVPADQEYTLIASKEGFEDRVINLPAETLGQEEDILIVMNQADENSQRQTTELDPLAVNDDPWSDSDLNPSSEPGINGVALTELPETTLDKDETIPGNELDPLAVTEPDLG